jgi:MFS family permease
MELESIMSSRRIVGVIVLSIILFKMVTQTQSTLFLWFSRTLIHCADSITVLGKDGEHVVTTPKRDHMDKDWSGSPYCSNRDYVANWAQTTSTAFIVTNTACSLIFVPMFGSLSDKWGRRFLLKISVTGVLVLLACLAVAAVMNQHGNRGLVVALVVIGAAVNGATSTFGLAITSMIIDVHVRSAHETSSSFSSDEGGAGGSSSKRSAEDGIALYVGRKEAVLLVGSAIGGAIGLSYITLNIENYAPLFFCLCIPQAVNLMLTFVVPETLPKAIRRSSLRKQENLTPVQQGTGSLLDDGEEGEFGAAQGATGGALIQTQPGSVCATWPLVLGNPTIRIICLFVFFFALGGSCVIIAQVFMTTQFGWTATGATVAFMPGSLLILTSFLCADRIIKRFGALKSMVLASCLATLGMFIMSLASIGWPVFVAGLYILLSSVFGTVAYVQYIAARVDPGRMGAVQAGIAAFLKLGLIVGAPTFTAMNLALKKEDQWLSFFVGSIIAGLSCCLLYCHLGRDPDEEKTREDGHEVHKADSGSFEMSNI